MSRTQRLRRIRLRRSDGCHLLLPLQQGLPRSRAEQLELSPIHGWEESRLILLVGGCALVVPPALSRTGFAPLRTPQRAALPNRVVYLRPTTSLAYSQTQ